VSPNPPQSDVDLVVAAVADSAYAWPATLTLLSASTQTAVRVLCLLVGDQLSPGLVSSIAETFDRLSVPFEYADGDLREWSTLPTGYHFTRAAYGRLRVPEIARNFAARTLYLDADTLVLGDIADLAELEFAPGNVVGAVGSLLIPTCASPGGVPDWRALAFQPDAPFFNSGVLLIDNVAWIRRNVSASVVDRINDAPDAVTYADQGALNVVLYDSWMELPRAWNIEIPRTPAIRIGPLMLGRRTFSLSGARILHYFQALKPWDPKYPPGALRAIYRRQWCRLLAVPLDDAVGFRHWAVDEAKWQWSKRRTRGTP